MVSYCNLFSTISSARRQDRDSAEYFKVVKLFIMSILFILGPNVMVFLVFNLKYEVTAFKSKAPRH